MKYLPASLLVMGVITLVGVIFFFVPKPIVLLGLLALGYTKDLMPEKGV